MTWLTVVVFVSVVNLRDPGSCDFCISETALSPGTPFE